MGLPLSFSSIVSCKAQLYAASLGGEIFLKEDGEAWQLIASPDNGDGITINRLTTNGAALFACTDMGLYALRGQEWEAEELSMPCYHYKADGNVRYAATAYGLFADNGSGWQPAAANDRKVYDLLNGPQFLVIAHETGFSIYDRMMDDWLSFNSGTGITSLTVCQGYLLGAAEDGRLLVGNKKGGYDLIRFPGMLLFSVIRRGMEIFACSDKGLFRVGIANGNPILFSMFCGGPVIDMDIAGNECFCATLYEGIRQAAL